MAVPTYDTKKTFILRWENDTEFNLDSELKEIAHTMKSDYGFEISGYCLDDDRSSQDSQKDLKEWLQTELKDLTKQDLFIFLYSGHGRRAEDDPDTLRFYSKGTESEVLSEVLWPDIKEQLVAAKCNVLTILDCCFAKGEHPDTHFQPADSETPSSSDEGDKTMELITAGMEQPTGPNPDNESEGNDADTESVHSESSIHPKMTLTSQINAALEELGSRQKAADDAFDIENGMMKLLEKATLGLEKVVPWQIEGPVHTRLFGNQPIYLVPN